MKNGVIYKRETKVKIESGEELLHNVYNPKVIPGRIEKIIVGIDGGSTQTRTAFMRKLDEANTGETLDEIYVVPSTMCEISNGESIRSKGETLYNKLESLITNTSTAPGQVFDKTRVIRGVKLVDSRRTISRINSSINKVNTPAFYLNLIDGIAYGIIQDSARRGIGLAETYHVSMFASLPPDDVKSSKSKAQFLRGIKNSFQWHSPDLNVTFNIVVDNCGISTEPGAALKYQMATGEDFDDSTVLGIDGGGRSIGVEVMEEGIIVDHLSTAFRYGGTQLIQDVSSLFVSEHGTEPTESALREALKTGKVSIGNATHDIVDMIQQAKKDLAQRIFNDIVTDVFDKGSVKLEHLNKVIFTGRLFTKTSYGESLAEMIVALLLAGNPHIEVDYITGEYTIPSGNLVMAYTEFGQELQNNVEVPSLVFEDDEDEELGFEEIASDSQN